MFNLEKAIQTWKHSLEKYPSFSEEEKQNIEKLLQDEIKRLTAKGVTEEGAF